MNRFAFPYGLLAAAFLLAASGSAAAGDADSAVAAPGAPETDRGCLQAACGQAIPPYEILMTADTIARFDGIVDMPKWSPPGSGEPATRPVAVFSIISWQSYDKPGRYGDEQARLFTVAMDKTPPCQYGDALRDIAALKKGDIVRLCWMHIYIDAEGSRYPERPVTWLKPARLPEGAQLPPPYTPPPLDRQPRPLMRTR